MNDQLLHLGILSSLVIGLTGLGTSLFNTRKIRELNSLRNLFFAGNKTANLEDTIHSLMQGITQLQDAHIIQENELSNLQKSFLKAVQKVGVVRFNPFGDPGGNFSFSLALLDATNSGVVITSIHGRQQNRIYSKRIANGHSETLLTEEEQKAISLAHEK